MFSKSKCFTQAAQGRLDMILTDAGIGMPYGAGEAKPANKTFRAIWDTGASGSVITQNVVDDCGLKPTGMVNVNTAGGMKTTESFLVHIALPNSVYFRALRVTKADLGNSGCDILIGMDIISHGDFAITNFGGKTMFSFRLPSIEQIDFKNSAKDSLGKNDPCACGSGEKFKDCCMELE